MSTAELFAPSAAALLRQATWLRGAGGRLGALARAILASFAERRRARRTRAQLAALSDRLLADIGLERSDIARVARYGRDGTNKRAVAELQR